jgi:predicted ATPase/DNA-binding CsgD family transcriptional regulator
MAESQQPAAEQASSRLRVVGPSRLPVRLTSFVGRTRELEHASGTVAETRLLTLTGAGGAGKTRLALQLASASRERFIDGVWWVELAALADSALVSEAVAAALGVRPLPGVTALDASCTYLAARRGLVVLDNCEHLRASCAEVAEALLLGCPNITIVATSRTPLGVDSETAWRVPPLDTSDAVSLFLERARTAHPTLVSSDADTRAIGKICADLDGLPLAIELAAARVRMMPVEQIAARMDDRFHLLTGGTRTGTRHRSLRTSLDWSHELLTEPERHLFRRLSAFAGGFTLEACEHVCAGAGLERRAILDLLASLVDQSLVVAVQEGSSARYRLLETMREYALEQLRQTSEEAEVRARHLDWFLALAERSAAGLETAQQSSFLEVLDPEAANFAVALDWAVAHDGHRALRLCGALTLWWRHRCLLASAERSYVRALDADPAASPARARALWGRGVLLFQAAEYEAGLASAQAAADMAAIFGDDAIRGRALGEIGELLLYVDPVGSRPTLEQARELAAAGGSDWSLVGAEVNLAMSFAMRDEYDEAVRRFRAALPLAEQKGLQVWVALALVGLGVERLARADADGCRAFAERSLAASGTIGDAVTDGLAHMLIGLLEVAQGRYELAITRLERSRERIIDAGAAVALPFTETWLAAAHAAVGDLDIARARLEAVIASGADFGRALAVAMLQFADILRVSRDLDGAEQRAQLAQEIGDRIGSPTVVAWCRELLGRLAAERGEHRLAETKLHEALALRMDHALLLWLPQTFDALAEIAAGLDSHEEAACILGAAERARSDLGLVRWAPDDPRYAQLKQLLREALGEEVFAVAYADGGALTRDEAVAWLRRARGERKRPPRGWDSLTPTELQVVALVAGGLTNPQIGQRMFISRGTVKVHLSHIFAKLGISTRAQLAAEATRRGVGAQS